MKILLELSLPKWFIETIRALITSALTNLFQSRRQFRSWRKRGCLNNSPQLVKQNIFVKYRLQNAVWIETGTYLGTTRNFSRKRFPHVYTMEPEPKLYANAMKQLYGQNVTLFRLGKTDEISMANRA